MRSRNEGPEMQKCSSCREPSWILELRVSAGGLDRADPGAPVALALSGEKNGARAAPHGLPSLEQWPGTRGRVYAQCSSTHAAGWNGSQHFWCQLVPGKHQFRVLIPPQFLFMQMRICKFKQHKSACICI